jgi:hypothetical protein
MRDSVPVALRTESQAMADGTRGFSLVFSGSIVSDLILARGWVDQRDCHGMVSARRIAVAMKTNPLMAETTPRRIP